MTDPFRAFDRKRIEDLYHDLCQIGPHPNHWMGVMIRPSWWQWRHIKSHQLVCATFRQHGFALTGRTYFRFVSADPQRHDEDAGGAITRMLAHALQVQHYLNDTRD